MSLSNKSFRNNKTGETIRVIDSFEDIAVLENKGKEKVSNLLNPELYTEQIDINNFFNNQGAYNILAEKIKNIPPDQIRDESGEVMINMDGMNYSSNTLAPTSNESAVVVVSEEDERAELARKYGVINSQNDAAKQAEAFDKLLNPESESVQKVEVNRNPQPVQQIQSQPVYQAPIEDPIVTMFKNVKRVKDFSISLEIKNKIPRPDFIEMMEDSYNTSIIDFLAAEFTDNLLRNPQLIEDMIKQKIKEVVYGVEKTETPVNPQITDAVTQLHNEKSEVKVDKVIKTEPKMVSESGKKTTTRKPRVKKESSK